MRVLIADDNTLNRQMLRAQLEYLGCKVIEASNGLEALEAWRAFPVDWLITDYHMPVMDGVELTLAIRKEEQQRNASALTILGLTADAQQEEMDRCLNAGMGDCLIKPISLAILEQRLASLEPADKPAYKGAKPTLHGPEFDMNLLQPITGGNPAIIQQLQAELMRSNQQDIEQLRDFSETRDLAGIAELAHRLRGSAALMRNDYLLGLCKELEHGCRTGAEDVPAQVRQVKKELRRIQNMLEP